MLTADVNRLGYIGRKPGAVPADRDADSWYNRNAFFAWLDAQKQADEAEKARKQAEAEAEKKRKEQEAKARRMETERRDFLEYLDAIVKEWGAEVVKQWIKEWLR